MKREEIDQAKDAMKALGAGVVGFYDGLILGGMDRMAALELTKTWIVTMVDRSRKEPDFSTLFNGLKSKDS